MQAVGLNPSRSGVHARALASKPPELPSRIGYEAAGIVEAVGPGVDPSWVGKQIATVPGYSMSKNGVLGEEAIVPARLTRRISGQAFARGGRGHLDAIFDGLRRAGHAAA